MPKITLDEFLNGSNNLFIQCDTEEQAKAFCDAMYARGKQWRGGESFAEKTFFNGDSIWYRSTLQYSRDRDHALEYTVYHFNDIIDFSATPPEPDPNQFRVLLRSDYRWHNACWDEKNNELTVYGRPVSQVNILSIENDPRIKYVRCKMCDTVFKNTKKAIEEHAQLAKSSKSCLTCKSLCFSDETNNKESFTKNDDGTYTRTKKCICQLTCGYTYGHPQIDSDKARERCRYRNCSLTTIEPVENFFTKYPGAFDDMATVDALDMNKWQIYSKYSETVYFKLKGRYNITVSTNGLGIINVFTCDYRSNSYEIVYSKKYDKIFELYCGEYSEITETSSKFSETYYNELMKIMRNIYKGED
jgi:hypothetical protein